MVATFETESEILERVISPRESDLTPDAAMSLLKLRFGASDQRRMNQLAGKARRGTLSPEEDRLLQGYLFVGSLVDLLHSKARLSLKRRGDRNGE